LAVASQKTTEGVGFKTDQFKPWWEDVYNRAATKIVSTDKSKVEKENKQKRKENETKEERRHRREQRKLQKERKIRSIKSKQ